MFVLNGDEIEVVIELVNVIDGSDTTSVVTVRAEGQVADVHRNEVLDLVLLKIELEGITDLDVLVSESDGPSVVGDEIGDLVWTECFLLNLAKFELGFGVVDFDESETSFDVIKDAVILLHFRDFDDVHKADRVLVVPTDLLVDLDKTFLIVEDKTSFAAVQGKFELVSEDDLERNALAELVWALGGAGSEVASHLVHKPGVWSGDSFKMFLGSSCHGSME